MLTRRQILHIDTSDQQQTIRPPWSMAETAFLGLCSRCNDCISTCPTGIIVSASGGFPAIDFQRGECLLCGECVKACPSGALSENKLKTGLPGWLIKAEFDHTCLAHGKIVCQICAEQCEVLAIRFIPRAGGVAIPELETELCMGCGACVAACPTQAIHIKDPDLTEVNI